VKSRLNVVFGACLLYLEDESVGVSSCFFDFENFEVTNLAGGFDVRVLAGCFVEAFDFYDSDFFH
jgi:hypothetical protein